MGHSQLCWVQIENAFMIIIKKNLNLILTAFCGNIAIFKESPSHNVVITGGLNRFCCLLRAKSKAAKAAFLVLAIITFH